MNTKTQPLSPALIDKLEKQLVSPSGIKATKAELFSLACHYYHVCQTHEMRIWRIKGLYRAALTNTCEQIEKEE